MIIKDFETWVGWVVVDRYLFCALAREKWYHLITPIKLLSVLALSA